MSDDGPAVDAFRLLHMGRRWPTAPLQWCAEEPSAGSNGSLFGQHSQMSPPAANYPTVRSVSREHPKGRSSSGEVEGKMNGRPKLAYEVILSEPVNPLS